jgi:hypothetical protein
MEVTPAPAIKTSALTSDSVAQTFDGSGDGLIYFDLGTLSTKALRYRKNIRF